MILCIITSEIMKPFLIVLIFCSFLFKNEVSGQYRTKVPGQPNRISHDLGLSAGFTTGIGLAYRLWYSKFGAQVSFLPFNNGRTEFYSGALSIMYAFHATDMHRFFMYQGNHFMSYNRFKQYEPFVLPTETRNTIQKRHIHNGIGFGYEFFENEGNPSRFGFSIQGGIAAYNNFTRSHFTAETSFMYRFH